MTIPCHTFTITAVPPWFEGQVIDVRTGQALFVTRRCVSPAECEQAYHDWREAQWREELAQRQEVDTAPPFACPDCVPPTEDDDPIFCPACMEELSEELTEHVKQFVREGTGHCIRCFHYQATVGGLLCQACYAEVALEAQDTDT